MTCFRHYDIRKISYWTDNGYRVSFPPKWRRYFSIEDLDLLVVFALGTKDLYCVTQKKFRLTVLESSC